MTRVIVDMSKVRQDDQSNRRLYGYMSQHCAANTAPSSSQRNDLSSKGRCCPSMKTSCPNSKRTGA
ncbi:hypothetical protein BDR22DRAFT_863060 [Usnea florida]